MSEGFDVDLPSMHAGAAGLHDDASALDAAARGGGDALVSASAAAGDGPLEGVASALTAQLDSTLSAARRNLTDTAIALEAASATYQSSDSAASRGIQLPGF